MGMIPLKFCGNAILCLLRVLQWGEFCRVYCKDCMHMGSRVSRGVLLI